MANDGTNGSCSRNSSRGNGSVCGNRKHLYLK